MKGRADKEDIKKELRVKMIEEVASQQKEQLMKYKNKTIHKNKKCNSWYTRFRYAGNQFYISGKTQLECLKKLKDALKSIESNNTTNKIKTVSFIEWYKKWLTLFKKDIRPETIKDYNKNLNKLSETFKNKDMNNISALEIQNILQKETKSRARQKLYEFLKPIFSKAKDYKIIEDNIFNIIEKPKHTKEEGIALTQNQQKEFLKLCDSNLYGNMFKFILYQGLRIGEALALTYKDINQKEKTLSINKQLTPDGIVNYTKNQQSTRIIPIFKKSEKLIDVKNNSVERIFNINYRVANYNLGKIIKNSNLPKISIHDLRHTFITNCKNKDIPEHVIQALVGHEIGSKVTRQVYTHFNREDNLSYIDKLN